MLLTSLSLRGLMRFSCTLAVFLVMQVVRAPNSAELTKNLLLKVGTEDNRSDRNHTESMSQFHLCPLGVFSNCIVPSVIHLH